MYNVCGTNSLTEKAFINSTNYLNIMDNLLNNCETLKFYYK